MGKVITVVAVLLLAGCGPSPVQKIEESVRAKLKDSESGKFSEIRASANGLAGCGLVNSKNSMGGYTGNVRFAAVGEQLAIENDDNRIRFDTCCDAVIKAADSRIDSDDADDFGFCRGIFDSFSWPD